jgi:hypothetical protein
MTTPSRCTACGTAIAAGTHFCGHCGLPLESEPPARDQPSASPAIIWETAIPLLTSRDIVLGVIKGFGIALFVIGALMTLILGSQGEWQALPALLGMMALITFALLVVAALVMMVVFRNRLRVRYTIDAEAIRFELIDTTARTTNRLAFWLGVLTGRPQAIGAGLLAQSQETMTLSWSGAFAADCDSRRRLVTLKNRWRNLLVIHCTEANYAQVADRIESELAANGTAERHARQRSRLPGVLAATLITVIACLPAFLLVDAFHVSLLLPICLLCFALTTVWLLPVFAYVNLGLIALHVGAVLLDAFSVRRSFFDATQTYQRWTVYGGDDWSLLALAALGFAWLSYYSLGLLRGRFESALAADFNDMGE